MSMRYFVLRYDVVVDDYVNRRTPFRPEHLRLLREAHARGEVVMGGAVGYQPDGAIIVFRSETADTAGEPASVAESAWPIGAPRCSACRSDGSTSPRDSSAAVVAVLTLAPERTSRPISSSVRATSSSNDVRR